VGSGKGEGAKPPDCQIEGEDGEREGGGQRGAEERREEREGGGRQGNGGEKSSVGTGGG
jgi:hypothetical protein